MCSSQLVHQSVLDMLRSNCQNPKTPLGPQRQEALTAEGDDAHGVQLVLWADVWAHANDEDVADAGGGGHHPHEDPQHDVGQQVLEGRDAVRVGLTAAHVRRIAAVLELLEVAAAKGEGGNGKWGDGPM